jgi:hypothetical protein
MRFHALKWVLSRKDMFAFLKIDAAALKDSKELTAKELDMLQDICDPNCLVGARFWATAQMMQKLCVWPGFA